MVDPSPLEAHGELFLEGLPAGEDCHLAIPRGLPPGLPTGDDLRRLFSEHTPEQVEPHDEPPASVVPVRSLYGLGPVLFNSDGTAVPLPGLGNTHRS